MGLGPTRERLVDPMTESSDAKRHDDMCRAGSQWDQHCMCQFISRVRSDERSKLAKVMGQVSHQNADQGNRITVFAGKPVNGSVLVWQDGQYVWVNPR